MNELVLGLLVKCMRMPAVAGFGEGEGFLFRGLKLSEVMKAIVAQEASINVLDVTVSAGSVGFIVDDFPLYWD